MPDRPSEGSRFTSNFIKSKSLTYSMARGLGGSAILGLDGGGGGTPAKQRRHLEHLETACQSPSPKPAPPKPKYPGASILGSWDDGAALFPAQSPPGWGPIFQMAGVPDQGQAASLRKRTAQSLAPLVPLRFTKTRGIWQCSNSAAGTC